jgi:RNA polymerase sigma factor (TIGR02999 family)
MNCSKLNFSARSCGGIFKAVNARSSFSCGQSSRNSFNIIFRRWEKARLTIFTKISRWLPGQTLQPTVLVHEAWLRLVGPDGQAQFHNRAHFFGAAAEAMRRILIENARRKRALRHGGGQQRLDIREVEIAAAVADDDLLALNDALDKLATRDKEKAELVKLRYFAGMSFEEAAEILGISVPTANRWWAYARAWLFKEITAPHS